MRFTHRDGSTVHLAYCTNVHPAESLDGVIAQLAAFCEPVRRRLGIPRLGVGLWLARDAVEQAAARPGAVDALRGELQRRGLEVVTLNGFPYAGFGGRSVKHRVYRPDWTDPRRLSHTIALARLLARLLPDDAAHGTISTLPLAWRTGFDAAARTRAMAALAAMADALQALHQDTGVRVRLAVEPEPGCAVDTTADALPVLAALPADRIGLCLDTCHLATGFEDPATAVAALGRAGIDITKVQVSAALHAADPADRRVRQVLAGFDEPRFLHQTRARHRGRLLGTDDLRPALDGALPDEVPWRCHFHVPLTTRPTGGLDSTVDLTRQTLELLLGGPAAACHHLEVETYTWQVLPPPVRPATPAALADGVAAELAWVRDLLTGMGLKEQP